MPETRSSATDQVMSQTSLNKVQRQMDSVLKSWGFRTSRDPFQQNSSQGLEANKGQKSTPLREVVCPLEREQSLGRLAVFAGALTSLQLQPHRFLKRSELWSDFMQCSFGTCLGRKDVAICLVYSVESHLTKEDDGRKVDIEIRPALNDSEPSPKPKVIRFFDVLTARVFQEKKS